MRDTPDSTALRERVIDALVSAHMRLNPSRRISESRTIMRTSPCADLWDDSLELIELLMAIEEELDQTLRANAEFNWRTAPPRDATINQFLDWLVKEISPE